jgi:hypothetical protein
MPPKPIVLGGLGVVAALIAGLLLSPSLSPTRGGPGGGDDTNVHLAMRVVISIVLLGSALWVILSGKYAPADRHWAYGALGTIIGAWLPS